MGLECTFRDFNPLPSHEGRRNTWRGTVKGGYFNPLPSHEGRLSPPQWIDCDNIFQSTPLSRGETPRIHIDVDGYAVISIHSPLTRGDFRRATHSPGNIISIHSPLTRGDGAYNRGIYTNAEFQSTPLSRGETESTFIRARFLRHFNPLPSHEGRQLSTATF